MSESDCSQQEYAEAQHDYEQRKLADELTHLRHALAEAREFWREQVIEAYIAGAQAVHDNWQPDRAPDFTEAAHDYWAAIDAEMEVPK